MPDRTEPSGGFSDFDSDSDFDEETRELLMEEHANYNDNFARSSEEGWFYSDDD